MKKEEFRIGNLINYVNAYGIMQDKIHCLNYTTLTVGDNYRRETIKYRSIQPIPLTEEWLVKFGAECYEFDNGNPNQYRIKERLFVLRGNLIFDYGADVCIKHVHQLQNLYFALTGEELILKKD